MQQLKDNVHLVDAVKCNTSGDATLSRTIDTKLPVIWQSPNSEPNDFTGVISSLMKPKEEHGSTGCWHEND